MKHERCKPLKIKSMGQWIRPKCKCGNAATHTKRVWTRFGEGMRFDWCCECAKTVDSSLPAKWRKKCLNNGDKNEM